MISSYSTYLHSLYSTSSTPYIAKYSDLAQESVDAYEMEKNLAAAGGRYMDPRGSLRSSVSSFGTSDSVDGKPPLPDSSSALSDIKAFLKHVKEQRGVTEKQLEKYASATNTFRDSAQRSSLSDAINNDGMN